METLDRAARIGADEGERYEVIEGDVVHHRDTVINLWRGHIGWRDQLERMYDAYYLDCPHGQPLLRLLRDRRSGQIVGTIGAGPRHMRWKGCDIRAAVLSQMVVLPGHRSVAPAVKLARAIVGAGTEHFDLIYALPNAMSGAICRRAGFRPVGQLQRHVKVLRYAPYLSRVLPGLLARPGGSLLDAAAALARHWRRRGASRLHAIWTDTIDPRMEALWKASEHGEALITVRTSAMLQWRLLGLPALDRRFLLISPEPDGPLVAWFACEANVRDTGIMTVTDAWSAGGVRDMDRAAIRALCAMARQAGFHAVEVSLAAAPRIIAAWRAAGFVPRGHQPLFAKWTSTRAQGDIAGADLHLTDIEHDG